LDAIRTTTTITQTFNPTDGAASPVLIFPHGTLKDGGAEAIWYAVQVTDNSKFTLHRIKDSRGLGTQKNHKTFTLQNAFAKTGTFRYCNNLTSDQACNIFQQTSSPKLWVFVQFNWADQTIKKELNLNHPGDASYIDFFTKNNKHLYYRVIDAASIWRLYYLNLDTQPDKGTISAPF
jgi:hypothetical protein